MNDFQKAALGVIFSLAVVSAWITQLFLYAFDYIEEVNAPLQGIAIATICLVIGIATPVGGIVARGAKRVGKSVKNGISGLTQ